VRRWQTLVLGNAVLAAFLLAGCGGGSGPPSSQIFLAPPWDGPERLTYELTDQGDNVTGACIAETMPGDDGTTTLMLNCSDGEGNHDDGTALVDAQTLRPFGSERTVVNVDADPPFTDVSTAEYQGDTVTLRYGRNGDLRNERDRDLPVEPGDDDDPIPGYYDDLTLFWLVRGLALHEDYDGAFDDINALALVQIVDARIRVDGTARITTDAGTFDTWRLRLDTETTSARFWVAMDEPHYVVRARLERTEFELISVE
jgi:hypothetical protein